MSSRFATATSILAAACLFAAAGATLAEPPADTPADKAPLRGPAVTAEAPARPTLVEHDFAGRLVKLDMPPAEAAVRLMTLDSATRQRVDEILLQRSRILDKLVTDNLDLIVRLQGARDVSDPEETARLYQDLAAKAQPLRDRGQLAQELMAVLSPDEGKELRRLIQEYWRALVAEELADKRAAADGMAPAAPPAPPAAQDKDQRRPLRDADTREAMRREVASMVGGEIRRAYERTIGASARNFDRLLQDLNVTPEQDAQIRKVVGDAFQQNHGKATPQERAKVFAQVYQFLDAEQKAEVLRRLGPHAEQKQ